MDVYSKAKLLIFDIQHALRNGTKHYRPSDGKELTHVTEVLATLRDEGSVRLVFGTNEPDVEYAKHLVAKI